MKTINFILLLCLIAVSVAACNTTRGFGQDLKSVGNSIEEAADDDDDDE